MKLLKAKVEEVKYPMTGKYNDDSKSILNENGVHNDEIMLMMMLLMMMMKNYLK